MSERILSNRYTLESEIGRGGMGVVYRATDTQVQRTVAIKTLPAVMSHNQDLMRRFTSEVQHASKLEHPNIVRVYDVGEDDGTHFYVMQYIDGSDLHSQMKSKGRYSVDETISIISQVADALDYAHSQGIVHRDIKPENVLLDSEGNAHVADFGIAKATEGTRTTRGMLGTPEYMSPEQVRGKRVDGRSDQYSLAVVAYEMLTGRTPFKTEGDDPWAQINMHLNTPVPNPRTIVPDLPAYIANTLLQAMAKDSGKRFASCGEFLKALTDQVRVRLSRRQLSFPAKAVLGLAITAVVVCTVILAAVYMQHSPGKAGSVAIHKRDSKIQILYVDRVNDVLDAVYAMNLDGTGKCKLATLSSDDPWNPASETAWITTDGQHVVYAHGTERTGKAIIIQALFTSDSQEHHVSEYSSSPIAIWDVSQDGTQALVHRPNSGQLLYLDQEGLHDVTSKEDVSLFARFIPGTTKIVYVKDIGEGYREIYTSKISGEDCRKLSDTGGRATTPSVSPDGDRIAFGADSEVWILGLNGGGQRSRCAVDGYSVFGTCFSPDGRVIAFLAKPTGEGCGLRPWLLCTVPCDGSQFRSLASVYDPVCFRNNVFSPDGKYLSISAKDSVEALGYKIVVVNLQTGKISFLTSGKNPIITKVDTNLLANAARADQATEANVFPPPGYKVIGNYSADFDGDGNSEVAAYGVRTDSQSSGDWMAWINKDQKIVWKAKPSKIANFLAADVTGDGIAELIYTTAPQGSGIFWSCHVCRWDGNAFKNVWSTEISGRCGDDIYLQRAKGKTSLVVCTGVERNMSNVAPNHISAKFLKWNGRTLVESATRQTTQAYNSVDEAKKELGITGSSLYK